MSDIQTVDDMTLKNYTDYCFNLLKKARENTKFQTNLDNITIPQQRVQLSAEQLAAEEFNEQNYRKLDIAAKNSYFNIINTKHRLYGKNIIAGLVTKKSNGKQCLFYIDKEDILKISNYTVHINNEGYAFCKLGFIHNVVSNYDYVHHKNAYRLDDYKDNLEHSTALANAQDKITTSYGMSGISTGSNVSRADTKKLFKGSICRQYIGEYREYLVAVINVELAYCYLSGEALTLDNFRLKQIVGYHTKYTTLTYDFAKCLYDIFIKITTQLKQDSGNIQGVVNILSSLNLDTRCTIYGDVLIDEKSFIKKMKSLGGLCDTSYIASRRELLREKK